MIVPSRPETCGYADCGRQLEQTSKTGRRRTYCDARCRRRAQRARDRAHAAAVPPPSAVRRAEIAADITTAAQELLGAEQRHSPLELRLTLTKLLSRDVTCYLAGAVQDARSDGTSWAAIAAAAEVTEASARARWSEAKVSGLLAGRAVRAEPHRVRPSRVLAHMPPPDWMFTQPSGPEGRAAAQVLRRSLTALSDVAALPVAEVARQAGLPDEAVVLSLSGELVASWPVTHMLTTILGGQPHALRTVWELAAAPNPPGARPEPEARRRLREVLRALSLTAGAAEAPAAEAPRAADTDPPAAPAPPGPAEPPGATGATGPAEPAGPAEPPTSPGATGPTAPQEVRAALDVLADLFGDDKGGGNSDGDGDTVPDWPTTARIAVRLGGEPEFVRPFWAAWDRARRHDPGPGAAEGAA